MDFFGWKTHGFPMMKIQGFWLTSDFLGDLDSEFFLEKKTS